MGSDWSLCKVGDIANIQGGYAFKSKDFIDTGIPVIKIKNVRKRDIDLSDVARVSEEVADNALNYFVKNWDVLISMTGSGPNAPASIVGRIARHSGKDDLFLINQRVGRFVVKDKEKLDQRFLYYLLSPEEMQLKLLAIATGSANQVNISGKQIESIEVNLPPLPEQKAIAHILGSLDDKIELNRQMNETLEAMAQALFKSWFVDFDPVIDNALAAGNPIPDELSAHAEQRQAMPPSDTDNHAIRALFPDAFEFTEEMGWIPEGWVVNSLESVCSKITDGSHSSPRSVDKGYPMASVKDMHNWGFDLNTCRKISEEDYDELKRNNCNPLKDDVLIAKDGSYLKHIFVVEKNLELVVLSSIAMLRPNKTINPHFLSLTLKRKDVLRKMENYVSGAVLQRIVLRDFRKFLIVNPPIEIQKQWFNLVEGMFEASWNNIHTSNSLAKLRDTLLPKLLSGELRITDAAAMVEDV